jgi:dTDP-4-amino-4,6-dideoxygalactose transaminase
VGIAQIKTSFGKSNFALFGAPPTFPNALHVGRPNIGDRKQFRELVDDLLDRRWLTNNGPLVQRFENEVAEILGVRHCIAICNGTVALEIAIRAIGLKGEVIVPSFTFVALAHSLQWQKITPVFCDIDPLTHTIDPGRVEELITPRTSGVIGVHLWGQVCDVERLEEITRRRGLELMYDASHAFGCSRQGTMIGNFGRCEVFSFHATKFVNCLEGGAIVTNDDRLAKQIRLMKNFGFSGYDEVIYIGTNGKMNEISAAMGLVNLDSRGDFVRINRRNRAAYADGLSDCPGIELLPSNSETCNFQYVVAEVDEDVCPLKRDELIKVLHSENVLARRYFWPGCHRMEPYRSYFPHASLLLPRTEKVANRVLVLPTGSAVGVEDIRNVCSIIHRALIQADQIKAKLASHE